MECQIENSKFTFGKEFLKPVEAGLLYTKVSLFGLFIKKCGLTWRVSDCEELVRGLVTRNNGVKFIVGIAAYSIADCIS